MPRHSIRLGVWLGALTILLGSAFVASGQNMHEQLGDYADDGTGGVRPVTEAEVLKEWERRQTGSKVRLPNPSVPPDVSLQRIIANHKSRFRPSHGTCDTQIYTTTNNQGPGPLKGPLTFITAQWTLPTGRFNFGQVLVIGHYYKAGELHWASVVCGGGDSPAQVAAWLKAMYRPGAGEKDQTAKPERPTLTVTGTETRDGRLRVTGTITSKTPIRSTLMMRTEGGQLTQGQFVLNGKSFTADCALAPGVPNVFKLTCENEDGLGAEVTLRTDAAGQVGGLETTSAEGDVAVKTAVPGMGSVGDVPGPASPGQAAAGLLIPSLLAAVLRGLLGGGGGRPVSPVAPRPAMPPPVAGPPVGAKRAADGKAGTSVKPPPPPPPPPAVDATTARALATFDKLSQLAAGNKNPDLAAAVEKAAREALGPDGKVSPERWDAAKAELKQALTRYEQSGDKPTWVAADVARSAARATYELGAGAATGVASIATGLGSLGWSAIKGAVGTVAHPIDTTVSAVQAVGQWADNNCPEIKKGFDRGVAEGKLGDVAGHAFAGFGFAACQAGKALVNFVRNDVLPIDEVKSLFGADTGLEERMWAFAAGMTKVTSLATIFVTPTIRPATPWGAAIERTVAPYLEGLRNRGLSSVSAAATERATRIEANLAALEARAAQQPGSGSLKAVADSMRRQAAAARGEAAVAEAAIKADTATRIAMADNPALGTFGQAQLAIERSPQMVQALDDAIRANGGSNALGKLRAEGLIGEEAHTLLTARKLHLQDEALNRSMKRIITEEVEARIAAGEAIPTRFHGANATQGSRTFVRGSNINADLDFTTMGTGNVSAARKAQILQEECGNLGMTRQSLDINIYSPRQGLSDAAGAAANGQATLENILQTTGTSAHHQVYVTRNGEIIVSDMVRGQGREAVLHARGTMPTPAGMTRDQFLWEGHQGAPIQIAAADLPAAQAAQVRGFAHALEQGEMNQMCKYANRACATGIGLSDEAAALARRVAGQKDPLIARQIIAAAGLNSPQELARFLGMPA